MNRLATISYICAVAFVSSLGTVASCDVAAIEDAPRLSPPEFVQVPDTPTWNGDLPADEIQSVVSFLNDVRAAISLAPVQRCEHLNAAATGHAQYLATHHELYSGSDISPHFQVSGLEGFTGNTPMDRVVAAGYAGSSLGEVIAYKSTVMASTVSWLESLYHRLPLLQPQVNAIGYAQVTGVSAPVNVLDTAVGVERIPSPTHGDAFVYPPDGALDVPYMWDGNEVPQPQPPPTGYPSGPVFTAHYPGGAPAVLVGQVTTADGHPIPATLLTRAVDLNMPPTDVALVPHDPLVPETLYRVRIVTALDGVQSTTEWEVTTRREGCDLVTQDCGPGRGCYLQHGAPVCLWEGAKAINDKCHYTNDCAPGQACYGSRCVALCDLQPDAQGPGTCEARCSGSVVAHPQQALVGVCLPPSCLDPASVCGADEACYWSGAFTCHWAGQGEQGAVCDYLNDCSPGLGCLSSECRRFCGASGLPGCDVVCDGPSQLLDSTTGVHVCL